MKLITNKYIQVLLIVLINLLEYYKSTETNTHNKNTITTKNKNSNTNTNKIKTSNTNTIKNTNTNNISFQIFGSLSKHIRSNSNSNSHIKHNTHNNNKHRFKQAVNNQQTQQAQQTQAKTPGAPNPTQGAFGEGGVLLKKDGKLGKNTDIFELANMNAETVENPSAEIDLSQNILFQGWGKFYKFENDKDSNDDKKVYYKNSYYYKQQKDQEGINLDEKQGELYKYVHDVETFWITVFPDTINFSQSRNKPETNIFATISTLRIAQMPESQGFMGGITIVDPKHRNGLLCGKIKYKTTGSSSYYICMEDGKYLIKLLTVIKSVVLKHQREAGLMLMPTSEWTNQLNSSNLNKMKQDRRESFAVAKTPQGLDSLMAGKSGSNSTSIDHANGDEPEDGYWINLQGWSTCSKKCDGGSMTLHRMCVPPKNGGKQCKGEAIVTKSCNTEACPKIQSSSQTNALKGERLKPIVKIMPFSTRKQRYTKCVIKEADAMMVKRLNGDENYGTRTNYLKVPVRIIMNNYTIVVLQGSEYEKAEFTFDIAKTKMKLNEYQTGCFILQETQITRLKTRTSISFCPFGISKDANEWLNEWDYDFHLFQNQCKTPKEYNITLTEDDNKKMDDELAKAKVDLLAKRTSKIQQAQKEEEQVKQKEDNEKLELEAIDKEYKLEELLENEQREQADKEYTRMKLQLDQERDKKECLLKKIKQKQIENQYNLRNEESDSENKNKQTEIKRQILAKRKKFKNKLDLMKKRARWRRSRLDQEMKNVRMQINDELKGGYHKGCPGKCQFKTSEANKLYCKSSGTSNYEAFSKCIAAVENKNDFCIWCCEKEVGALLESARNKCRDSCESGKKVEGDNDDNKRWFPEEPIMGLLDAKKEGKSASEDSSKNPPINQQIQ